MPSSPGSTRTSVQTPDEVEDDDTGLTKGRRAPSASGETGLLRMAAAEGAHPGTLRLGFGLDFFTASGVFTEDDDLSRVGGTLALSGSPVDYLELWLNIRAQSTESSLTQPGLLQAQGDFTLGLKGYYPVADMLTLGADLQLTLLSGIGDASFDIEASLFRARLLMTADLRNTSADIPLRLHLNFGALVDGSDRLTAQTLSDAERFALGISDFHQITVGFAVEVPVKYVTPYVEYQIGVPLGYLATPGIVLQSADNSRTSARRRAQTPPPSADAPRPAIQRALPQTLTPGIRITALEDLTLDVAVEIGLTPEVASGVVATPPYNVWFLASYAVDPFGESSGGKGPSGPPVAVPVIVPEVQEVEARSKNGFVMGRVTNKKGGGPLFGAIVTFDRSPPVATANNGRFLSHEVEPGPLQIRIAKDGFKPAAGNVTIVAGQTQELNFILQSAVKVGIVRGLIANADGVSIPDASVSLIGKTEARDKSDADGKYEMEVKSGPYALVASAEGFYRSGAKVEVGEGTETIDLRLTARPEEPIAAVSGNRIRLTEKIPFDEGDYELKPEAKAMIDAVIDVILGRPALKKVKVESHVDSSGDEAERQRITRARAEGIVQYMVSRGVPESRLEWQGIGSARPLAPNLTSRGRAQNRRIEFIITDQ